MPTIVSIYSKHAGCILRLLNRTDCDVWLYQKNLWLFMFEMHLISGMADEPPTPPPTLAKLNVKTEPQRSLYFGIYYSFGFSRLLFFALFGVFSGDFGFLYSCSIPGLLLFLNYFLSVSQWAPFTLVSPWLKPLVTLLHLIKARLYCRYELCVGLAAISYNKSIVVS